MKEKNNKTLSKYYAALGRVEGEISKNTKEIARLCSKNLELGGVKQRFKEEIKKLRCEKNGKERTGE